MKKIHLILALLIVTVGLQAQNREIGVTLFGGMFNATSNVYEQDFGQLGMAEAKHVSSIAFGARVTNWVSPNIGLEASFNFAQSGLEGEFLGEKAEIAGSRFFSAIKVMLGAGSSATGRFEIGGGLGLVSSSYDELLEGDTHMTGVLSAGFSIPMGQNLALRFSAEDHLHKVWWVVDGVQTDEIFQNDLIFGLGLQVRNFY